MSDEKTQESEVVEKVEVTKLLADFLESEPPNQMIRISDLAHHRYKGADDFMCSPEIQLHCSNELCNGPRFFRIEEEIYEELNSKSCEFLYLTYRCSNCRNEVKTFSLAAKVDKRNSFAGECYKFGEFPVFGPPTSPKLIKLIGPDRSVFLKGRRCENQGLGIGAFTYYRRVVENQKNRILNEIIRVSEKIGGTQESIDLLTAAIDESRFSESLKLAKDAIPESLLIDGHNPLLLLHSALSVGLHSKNDDECLDIASSVRIVLGELSDRLAQALKDEVELSKALSTILKKE